MARRTTPPAAPAGARERRRAVRHAADPAAPCGCTVLNPRAARGEVRVRDLSASGAGLTLTRRVKSGTVLTLELRSADGGTSRTQEACVIYAEPKGAREFAAGVAFGDMLTDDEVRALLGLAPEKKKAAPKKKAPARSRA